MVAVDPRPGPGHLLRARRRCSRPRARCPTASTSCRSARRPSSARAATARSSRSRRWSRGPSRPPSASRRSTGSRPRSSTCARSCRWTSRTILASVEKTSRLFTVEENPRLCGWGAEIVSLVADEGFYSLDAPIVRITTPHVPLAVGAGPRGRGDPDGRPDRRHGPSPARGREVTDGDATPTVGVVGTGRMGSAMAKALARRRPPARRSTTGAGTGREALAGRARRAGGRDPGRGRRGRGRHDHDARRRRRGRPRSTAAPTGSSPGRAAARCSST